MLLDETVALDPLLLEVQLGQVSRIQIDDAELDGLDNLDHLQNLLVREEVVQGFEHEADRMNLRLLLDGFLGGPEHLLYLKAAEDALLQRIIQVLPRFVPEKEGQLVCAQLNSISQLQVLNLSVFSELGQNRRELVVLIRLSSVPEGFQVMLKQLRAVDLRLCPQPDLLENAGFPGCHNIRQCAYKADVLLQQIIGMDDNLALRLQQAQLMNEMTLIFGNLVGQ